MATIDAGSAPHRREVNRELPLIPFIDFLLCLVSFLLITAVWSQAARLEADALVPGKTNRDRANPDPAPELHVKVRPQRFKLEWRQAGALLATTELERRPVLVRGQPQYPDLARAVEEQWRRHGVHRSPDDPAKDIAVLHTENGEQYDQLIAVIDAVKQPQKTTSAPSAEDRSEAFDVAFAIN